MSAPEKKVCPTCNGEGYLLDAEGRVRTPCNCKVAEYMIKHLGTEIARAETIFESPLYELPANAGDPPPVDRTKENLHIKCNWTDLLPHLKLCLWPKGITFNTRIVTDEKIKTVYVGAESYTARAKNKRDDMTTMNSLGDLVGKEWDFVIIRLGYLGHKNVAAPGAVKEAVMIRDVLRKPTWLIEEPNSPFGPGNFTYSDELAEYIDRNFKTVSLGDSHDSAPTELRGFVGAEDIVGGVEDVSPSAPLPRGKRSTTATPPESVLSVEEELEMPGEDAHPKKGKWRGKYKRNGGGPL
jgi:hypothetical protein